MDIPVLFAEAAFRHAVDAEQRDQTGIAEAWRRCRELEDEAEADYRRKLAGWEADEPMRRAAELAYERAHRERASGPARAAACLDWTRPRPPGHLT